MDYGFTNATVAVCILAGGLSTRLRPLTDNIPKPMLPVAGRPFLELVLGHLAGLGLRRFVLAVSYRWEVIRDYFGDGSAFGWDIDYSVEPEPMGTGGAVLWAQPRWGRRALVLNGDTYCPANWPQMLEAHRRSGLPVTMALVPARRTDRFGRVEVRDGRVVRFCEKAGSGAGWINAGAYVLEAEALAGRQRGESFSLERDLFPAMVGRIGAFLCPQVPFADIGTAESLARFRHEVEDSIRKGV